MIAQWTVGSRVVLRKVHPCGSYEWQVYRVGADIGIRCVQCGRRLLMERAALEKRARSVSGTGTGGID